VSLAAELPVLLTAMMAGLLGSGHCFAMCGGIAGSLGLVSGGSRAGPALVFNGGRMASYMLLGAVVGAVTGAVGSAMGIPAWAMGLRVLTAIFIFLLGLQFLTGLKLLEPLERAGSRIWRRVSPFASRTAALPPALGRFTLGLCWGLLPCGLVYTMLLMAASTGAWHTGALVMASFGLGTMPSMLGMSLASGSIRIVLADRFVRGFIGGGLILLAVWSLVTLAGGTGAGHAH
jgi:hypothetical protein